MITCPRCKSNLPDGTQFCNRCGNQLPVVNPQKNMGTDFTPTPAQGEINKASSNKKYIYAIIALMLVIAIIMGIWLFSGLNKNNQSDHEKKLLEILEDNSKKPVVEFICDDFDSNGTSEAFAVVGETDNKNAKHPEYYDADIWYVNSDDAERIKKNVDGKSNGTIESDDNIYVSFEVYEDGTDEGFSFIYTADDNTFEEPDISGKYSEVHEENGKIIAIDSGNEIEIHISDDFKVTIPKKESDTENITVPETTTAETTTKKIETTTKSSPSVSVGTIIEPNASDFEKLNSFIVACDDANIQHYDCTSSNATQKAYDYVWGNGTAWFFERTYNTSGVESASDPLGKINNWSIKYYSAKDVDSFVKNVLNTTPDKSAVGYYSYDGSTTYYYHGDRFYTAQGGRGDSPFDYKTTYTSLGNGKYKTETNVTEHTTNKLMYKITATVALKSVDGRRVWSLYTYDHHSDTRPSSY